MSPSMPSNKVAWHYESVKRTCQRKKTNSKDKDSSKRPRPSWPSLLYKHHIQRFFSSISWLVRVFNKVSACIGYRFDLLLSHDCAFGNGRIVNFTELLHDLLNRYYKYWQNMWLRWPNILISVQTDWLWGTRMGGVNYKESRWLPRKKRKQTTLRKKR